MRANWLYPDPIPQSVENELRAYDPVIRQVLDRRGISTAEQARQFLVKDLANIPDPFELYGMAEAISLLKPAIEQRVPIAVFGDYDADGVTATALISETIRLLGGEVRPYIPNRFDEGYGLNKAAISALWQQGARILITVDCGIRGNTQIGYARELGFEVIVTDHHHPGSELPQANAIINPKQAQDDYSFVNLAGVGLSYKLAQALLMDSGRQDPSWGLDLVAVGTVADLAPLIGENRTLVAAGLDRINSRARIGLSQLIEVAGLQSAVSATDIAFRLAPRINASGRMESAEEALRLLTTTDQAEARELAAKLDSYNRRRQSETRRVVEQAETKLWQDPASAYLLFALDEDFHDGVVGLAASRLLEQHYKPVMVARQQGDLIRGSARSIPGFHITEALEQCGDLLLEFGGHAAAAGFQLKASDVQEFYSRMNQAAELQFGGEKPERELLVDAVVKPGQLDERLLDELEVLEPFGHENPAPLLVAQKMKVVETRRVGSAGNHLKLTVHDGQRYFDAIGFRLGELADDLPDQIEVAFNFEWNEFRGRKTAQLNIIDVKW